MNKLKRLLVLCLCPLLWQCHIEALNGHDVQQGNLLPNKKIEQLHLGMPKSRVIEIMGSTLNPNLFAPNRLDYAYTLKKPGQGLLKKHLVLHFKDNRLAKIEN